MAAKKKDWEPSEFELIARKMFHNAKTATDSWHVACVGRIFTVKWAEALSLNQIERSVEALEGMAKVNLKPTLRTLVTMGVLRSRVDSNRGWRTRLYEVNYNGKH